jgi:hypothetical protein
MATFEEGYARFCIKRGVPQELRPLLARVYDLIHEASVNLPALTDALVALLSFLCEPENRTSDSCRAVDLFFAVDDHWSVKWDILPEDYQRLLDDVGGRCTTPSTRPTSQRTSTARLNSCWIGRES